MTGSFNCPPSSDRDIASASSRLEPVDSAVAGFSQKGGMPADDGALGRMRENDAPQSSSACRDAERAHDGVVEVRPYVKDDVAGMVDVWNEVVRGGVAFPQEEELDEASARHLYESLGFVQLGTIPGGFRMPDGAYVDICPYYREL